MDNLIGEHGSRFKCQTFSSYVLRPTSYSQPNCVAFFLLLSSYFLLLAIYRSLLPTQSALTIFTLPTPDSTRIIIFPFAPSKFELTNSVSPLALKSSGQETREIQFFS